MSLWLYPIAESAERYFLLKNGSKVYVSIASYTKLVKNGNLAEDDWWYIVQNFNKVKVGDEIYIYTGDEDLGIIGYAVVKGKRGHDRNTWQLHLNIDLDKCRMLIRNPIPANIVRPWILPSRIKTVNNLDSFQSELEARLPWSSPKAVDIEEPSPPNRTTIETTRVIRDTKMSQALKRLYRNKCQLCDTTIKLSSRNYSETHHLQPLGKTHQGPDVQENMLVVCPNHHVQLDYGAIAIEPNSLEIIDSNGNKLGKLTVSKKHKLEKRYLIYHLNHVFQKFR
jgi:hypothetical protein